MIALSPVLLDHKVRLMLTYQPSAPLLSSCLKFNSPSKDCDVHALRYLRGMEHRRREKIMGDVVDCTLRTPSAAEPALSSSSTSASATSTTTRQPPTSKADRQVLQLRYQIAKKDKQNATLELAAVQDRAQISQLQTDLKHAQASKGSPSQLHENIAGKGA